MFYKEEIDEEPEEEKLDIQFVRKVNLSAKIMSTNKGVDLIEKKRELKRWKQSFNYYCLHPEKFQFGFKDFKQRRRP